MYTLEGVSSVANFITAYEESQLNRDSHFLIHSVFCFHSLIVRHAEAKGSYSSEFIMTTELNDVAHRYAQRPRFHKSPYARSARKYAMFQLQCKVALKRRCIYISNLRTTLLAHLSFFFLFFPVAKF